MIIHIPLSKRGFTTTTVWAAETLWISMFVLGCLDPFQSGLRPGNGRETAWIALVFACWEMDKGSVTLDYSSPLDSF